MKKKLSLREVPCNGCILCCQGDVLRLESEDNAAEYQTEPHPTIPNALMLAHKPNGDCIYLDELGCTIHDRAPSLCRIADCRTIARRLDFETAMGLHRIGKLDIRVWDQGRKLLGL
ncbi:MAG: YkgJ family cysteine cluster protein [bacterium]